MINSFDLFYIHINAFLRKTIDKAITRPNQAHMYSDQGYSSVFVNWTKQECHQTRFRWLQWWGIPDIIWHRVPYRRRSKRKWTITKCCLTMCGSTEKWHGVWAGASDAGVMAFYAACQWHMMVQYCCGSGSTNKLFCKCFLLWQEASEVILSLIESYDPHVSTSSCWSRDYNAIKMSNTNRHITDNCTFELPLAARSWSNFNTSTKCCRWSQINQLWCDFYFWNDKVVFL